MGRAMVIAWPFGHWTQLQEPKTYASVATRVERVDRCRSAPSHRVAPAIQTD